MTTWREIIAEVEKAKNRRMSEKQKSHEIPPHSEDKIEELKKCPEENNCIKAEIPEASSLKKDAAE